MLSQQAASLPVPDGWTRFAVPHGKLKEEPKGTEVSHMTQQDGQNLPLKKYRAGAVSATVWNNTAKDGESEYKTVTLERGYKDAEGVWHSANSLRASDLPKANLVLQKAYEFLAMAE